MIRWLRTRLSVRNRPLQDRLTALIAVAVASAVALTGIAGVLVTWNSVSDELDAQLVTLGEITSTWVVEDIETLGGVEPSALKAADIALVVVRADHQQTSPAGLAPPVPPGSPELRVARLQQGYSARTAADSTGNLYRIVAVPLMTSSAKYAVVVERPLSSTLTIMQSLVFALLVFGFTGVLLAAGIGFVIARSSTEPIRRLTEAVTRVTETDELAPIDVQGTNELVGLVRAFNTMLRSLGSSRERQRRLIGDAGHELRTPLTSMRTNVELLVADEKKGMLPAGARSEILRDIAGQLGEFTTLVGDLVHLSREDRVEPHPEPIDFRVVVSSAIERARRRGPGLTFDVELSPFYMVGEPDSLERAVTNLLDNAVKFSPPGGTIQVRLDGDRLRVSDEGPGIADADLPHVFERFYRSDKARNTPGSGLGLSIVAQTIKAHGGWVKAGRSAAGGAEFTIRLPGSSKPPEDEDLAPDEE